MFAFLNLTFMIFFEVVFEVVYEKAATPPTASKRQKKACPFALEKRRAENGDTHVQIFALVCRLQSFMKTSRWLLNQVRAGTLGRT